MYSLVNLVEFPTCARREAYLEAQERLVLQCLRGENKALRGADIKIATSLLARVWQSYLSLPGDVRPNQTKGIVHSSAWALFRQANKYAVDYDEIRAGTSPAKLKTLEDNLVRTAYAVDDMRLVRDVN